MILISPWAKKTTEGKSSPKNYPHWFEVVSALKKSSHDVVQLSCKGELDVPGCRRMDDLSFDGIAALLRSSETWLSVDTFLQHMAWTLGEPGVVIFGPSDPEIFGHPENINLLKDRRFLRGRQFGLWSQEAMRPEIFVGPEAVISAVQLSIQKREARKKIGPGWLKNG